MKGNAERDLTCTLCVIALITMNWNLQNVKSASKIIIMVGVKVMCDGQAPTPPAIDSGDTII